MILPSVGSRWKRLTRGRATARSPSLAPCPSRGSSLCPRTLAWRQAFSSLSLLMLSALPPLPLRPSFGLHLLPPILWWASATPERLHRSLKDGLLLSRHVTCHHLLGSISTWTSLPAHGPPNSSVFSVLPTGVESLQRSIPSPWARYASVKSKARFPSPESCCS